MKVWIASILFTFLPVSLLSVHQSLLFMEKFKLKEFVQNFLKCLAIHFGGNFFGPDSWHKKRLILFVFCSHGLIIWVFYNSSLTSELAQKKIQFPFEALWYKNENHWATHHIFSRKMKTNFQQIFGTNQIIFTNAKSTNYLTKKTNKTIVYLFIGLFIYMLLFLIAARSIQAEKGGLHL